MDNFTSAESATRETYNLIASDKVEGTAVRRSNGDKVGSIHRLMIDKRSGKVAYAVMAFGGFLGLGEDYYALPWNTLRYSEVLDAYELNISDDQLRGAPVYPTDESFRDRAWEQQVHDYYGTSPYWL